MSVLADQIAQGAAQEARVLVHAAAELLLRPATATNATAAATVVAGRDDGDGLGQGSGSGVLEVIERAAQQCAARIGLAAITGVLDVAGAATAPRAPCPGPAAGSVDPADDTITATAGAVAVSGGGSGHDGRLVARRPKMIRTLLGPVELSRGYYHCGRCKHGYAPLDARLGIQGGSLSPGLRRACALAGSEMPYAKSGEFIACVTGLDLTSTSTLTRATRTEGTRARALIAAEHASARPGPPAAASDDEGMGLCYIVIDGTGAPMLPSECTGKGKNGTKAGTREVKIGAFFTQSSLDTDGEPVQDPDSVTYISTFAPAPAFATCAKAEYHRRGFDQIRQPIVLGDGAKWIWNIANQHFPAATQIVDYYHAREHLHDLTRILTPHLTGHRIDLALFEQTLIDHLDLGHTHAIADTIDALDLPQHAPDLVKPAATEIGYFTGNHHRMQYLDFKAAGYYIGSGPVESACNTIVKQRAKRAGMHWTIKGLDPVLALRTLHQSHRDHILWPTPQT